MGGQPGQPVAVPASGHDRGMRMAALVDAARDGDRNAIGEIVTELSPLLWQVARAADLSSSDAEDVLQTVWLRLLTHLDAILTPSALTAWLVTTTRREAWRVSGTAVRLVCSDQERMAMVPDPMPGAEELAVTGEMYRDLWCALGKLSRRCQELLRIVAFVPRPDYGMIAVQLGMPQGSIGPTRGRCLAKLRALLPDIAEGTPL